MIRRVKIGRLPTRSNCTCSPRSSSSASASAPPPQLRIGIIGSGPAGFYAASRLLSLPGLEQAKVDLYELLPVPFGLARFGVAPDHPEVKNCQHKFEETARDPRFSFCGNVQINGNVLSSSSDPTSSPSTTLVPNLSPSPHAAQIPLSSLLPSYDAIILSYGASLDRSLSLPGETTLSNVLSARHFVNWYNGHPSSTLATFDLTKTQEVTIIGQGNVALDVARILLSPLSVLRKTDMPEYALKVLEKSAVKRVRIVGRRGVLQLAATTKEIREMMHLPEVGFKIDEKALADAKRVLDEGGKTMEGARARKRMVGLLEEGRKKSLELTQEKSWSLEFLRSPVELLPSTISSSIPQPLFPLNSPAVTGIIFVINTLVPPPFSTTSSLDPNSYQAVPTAETQTIKTDMVFTSVGYRSIGLPGVPFDEKRGVISNVNGRVVDQNGNVVPKLYVSGWLAQGPTGVIATTMFDAFRVADTVASDLTSSSSKESTEALELDGLAKGKKVVSWSDWERLDRIERERGAALGKEREKLVDVAEMLQLLES